MIEVDTSPEGGGELEEASMKAGDDLSRSDWRYGIDDPKLRDHAGRFASAGDLAKAHLDLRGKLSNAIIKPGRNASAKEVAAYRRALGVPDNPADYQLEAAEGLHSENDAAFRNGVAEAFHRAELTVEQGRQLTVWWDGVKAELLERQDAADRAYVDRTRAELVADWGQDADANFIHAARAAEQLFGDHFDAMKELQTQTGQNLLDHPHMLRALARLGREIAEGNLDGAVGSDERDMLAEQRDTARTKRNAALRSGNHAEARRWDTKEREIIAKMGG